MNPGESFIAKGAQPLGTIAAVSTDGRTIWRTYPALELFVERSIALVLRALCLLGGAVTSSAESTILTDASPHASIGWLF